MKCPACAADELQELSPTCPSCGFHLASLDRMMGIPPKLRSGITDLVGFLSKRQVAKLTSHLHELTLQFPQCRFAAVLVEAPAKVPFPVYVFWLFNKGGIAAPMEKGGDCRVVLLVIDTNTASCACMVGYGLEPFFTGERLQRITDSALPYLLCREFSDAFHASLDVVQQQLHEMSQDIPRLYGIREQGQGQIQDQAGESFAY
ncbi:hypothetical protein FEM03_06295 [Phragmitibacter flavus]|uniref:TPM domain-containing protein n=1 Tax=Phragmitibacter flavus TaxID=2576071 RepID=A0A5R8KHF1_9BACT|nr:TPM domain-containing protein [Phragmitibacter flavus]TLD71746.1 hypothetical protein FEM03_06295 [Phragmitibacter flavus]